MRFSLIAAGSGARGADRICNLDDRGFSCGALDLLVMRSDRIDDPLRHSMPARKICTNRGVCTFNLVIKRLANVVQESADLRCANVHAKLPCNSACNLRSFD
jgi:hypothetical protein